MEITKVFKACVKAAKVKNKIDTGSGILPRSKKKVTPSFNSKAMDVVAGVTSFKDFLIANQSDYLDEFSHVHCVNSMSEEERDQIEEDAQNFIKSCSAAINSLKKSVNVPTLKKDESEHRTSVLDLIERYLVGISKFYSQLKAFRVKQAIDVKRLSKLKPYRKIVPKRNSSEKDISSTNSSKKHATNKEKNDLSNQRKGKENRSSEDIFFVDEKEAKDLFHFSPEETQLFEEENDILYNQMNSLVKEIRNIEGKVIEIGQLQEIFHEKVLSQTEQIESIHTTAVATTENVNEGNEQIREAIKNSATFRVWVLFFLVMCTFSLLFLDWYNP